MPARVRSIQARFLESRKGCETNNKAVVLCMKLLCFLVCLLCVCSCSTYRGEGLGQPVTPVRTAGFSLRKDVIYTPEGWPEALPADVYIPQGDGPWPGVLLIHGGSWTGKDNRGQMSSIARRLARRGYVVMNATYRLAPKHLYPAQVHDLQQAARWMRRHTDELHLRPDRLATFGYSAGAHLGALIASIDGPKESRFQAVVAGGTPADLRKFPDSPIVKKFLGDTGHKIPEVYADASPVTHVSADDPPVFLYHGRWDMLVPADQASDYDATLHKAGVPHELFWQNGRDHVGAYFFDHDAVRAAIGFLDRQLRR